MARRPGVSGSSTTASVGRSKTTSPRSGGPGDRIPLIRDLTSLHPSLRLSLPCFSLSRGPAAGAREVVRRGQAVQRRCGGGGSLLLQAIPDRFHDDHGCSFRRIGGAGLEQPRVSAPQVKLVPDAPSPRVEVIDQIVSTDRPQPRLVLPRHSRKDGFNSLLDGDREFLHWSLWRAGIFRLRGKIRRLASDGKREREDRDKSQRSHAI